jgi:antitoxin (DNA-binding transcriptional repressor) of toxin-antitoxin stability system
MYHMTKASVRDLRYRFHEVEDLLRQGQEIQITKRRRVIARLVPERDEKALEIPDFLARLKKIYGKPLKVTGAEIISKDREDRFCAPMRTPVFWFRFRYLMITRHKLLRALRMFPFRSY